MSSLNPTKGIERLFNQHATKCMSSLNPTKGIERARKL